MAGPIVPIVRAVSTLAKAAKTLAKRKPLKKQSTPKSDMNRVMKQNDRQAAKEYKKLTGESIRSLTPGKGYKTPGAKKFQKNYKKPTKKDKKDYGDLSPQDWYKIGMEGLKRQKKYD